MATVRRLGSRVVVYLVRIQFRGLGVVIHRLLMGRISARRIILGRTFRSFVSVGSTRSIHRTVTRSCWTHGVAIFTWSSSSLGADSHLEQILTQRVIQRVNWRDLKQIWISWQFMYTKCICDIYNPTNAVQGRKRRKSGVSKGWKGRERIRKERMERQSKSQWEGKQGINVNQ